MINSQHENEKVIERVDSGLLIRLFSSQSFSNKLLEVVKKTERTGKEHGFGGFKKIGDSQIYLTKVRGGTSRDFQPTHADDLGDNRQYDVFCLHHHPSNGSGLASPGDLAYQAFLEYACSLSQIGSKPIGVVTSRNSKSKLIISALYQSKRDVDLMDVLYRAKLVRNKINTRASRSKYLSEDEEKEYSELLEGFFTTAALLYDSSGWLLEKGLLGWKAKERNFVGVEELLGIFSFPVIKNPKTI